MIEAAISLLSRIPWLAWPLVLSLAWGGVQTLRVGSLEEQLAAQQASAQAVLERTRAGYAAAAASAADAALAETERRINQQQGAIHAAEEQTARARADAAAAGDAGQRLRQRYAALAATCGRPAGDHPAAAASGLAAPDPGVLLADVQRRIDERAGELAAYADQLRVAGNACVGAYRALTQ